MPILHEPTKINLKVKGGWRILCAEPNAVETFNADASAAFRLARDSCILGVKIDERLQTFEDILTNVIRSARVSLRTRAPGECQTSEGKLCSLCHAVTLDYETEMRLKQEALTKFWNALRLPCHLNPLVPSPLGRNYRTTTKRRVFLHRRSVRLGLISAGDGGELKAFPVVQCAIEPRRHCEIFQRIQESILKPYAGSLTAQLSYVVIRGNEEEQTIIFNVRNILPGVVRAANTLSKSLTRAFRTITGLFLYEDLSSPNYYLGSAEKTKRPRFRKLFGKGEVFHRVAGRSFLFSPLSFSQVNHSILEKMIQAARTLLAPSKEQKLFDLYCGYGLLGLCLAGECKAVVGVESSPASISSAIANARRQNVNNARFMLSDINQQTIERIMHTAQPTDLVVLDPPRTGTADGVIECIAASRPARVLHVFCEIDLIPHELGRWKRSGYKPVRAIPLDMFPGTSLLETMVLLEPTSV